MKLIFTSIFIFLSLAAYTQIKHKTKVPSYFGVRFSPLFPTQFIGSKTTIIEQAATDPFNLSTTINQKTGYSFGATVRAGLTKLLALETGINYNQRKFDLTMSVPDSGIYASNTLTFIQYDVPINALFYIQLDRQWFMDASLGVAVTFSPTNIGIATKPAKKHVFYHTGLINNKVNFDINANLGFEYRTEKNGIFYLGGSARVPFKPLFELYMEYQYNTSATHNTINGSIDGSFLALELKYFFPNIKNKGPQFQNGPIEQ